MEAEGDGLTYTWYVKEPSGTKFSKSSVTSNSYSYKMTAAKSDRQVYCVVTDAYGQTIKTNTVTMSMEKTALKITEQPADASARYGKTATVTFEAEGDGLTYAWYYKSATGSKFTLTKTFTGNTYTAEMTPDRTGRQVYCVVTDAYGNSVKTNTVTLTMEKTELAITQQPTDIVAGYGKTAKVSFKAAGDGLTYAWYYKSATGSKFTLTTTFTGNSYTAEMNASRDGRQVYCLVTDIYGNTVKTDVVTLTLEKAELKITQQPADAKAKVGATVKTTVKAEGDGLTYTWYVKDPSAKKFTKSSTTSSTYSYKMTAEKSGRQVYCVITDAYGNTVKTNTVTLRKP